MVIKNTILPQRGMPRHLRQEIIEEPSSLPSSSTTALRGCGRQAELAARRLDTICRSRNILAKLAESGELAEDYVLSSACKVYAALADQEAILGPHGVASVRISNGSVEIVYRPRFEGVAEQP